MCVYSVFGGDRVCVGERKMCMCVCVYESVGGSEKKMCVHSCVTECEFEGVYDCV